MLRKRISEVPLNWNLDYEIKLENSNGIYAGSIFVDVEYYENEEIVGSVGVPNFDMRPLNNPVSSIVEPVQPPQSMVNIPKIKTSKRNFYSCMDD